MSIKKKKIVITGAGGIIGTVLRKGLKNDFNLTNLGLKADPENNVQAVDVRDFEALKAAIAGHDAIIHLAWAYWGDVDHNVALKVTEQNFLMYTNVYLASIEAKIPRVIMASSVHADNFWEYKGEPSSLLPNRVHGATGGYGANKRAVEEFGRTYAELELLEVVCLRIGAIQPNNDLVKNEESLYLSHEDCVSAVKTVLNAATIPGNFSVFYVISDNPGRLQSIENHFGWKPKNRSIEK